MPLLKRGTEIFPPGLFELSEEGSSWWVAHTRSRQEKALARYLEPLGVGFYLPHCEKQTRRAGRTFQSYLPLFPGYVFLRGPAAVRHTALRSNLVVRILEVPDQSLLNRELAQLRSLQESGASLVPYEELKPGDAVRVMDGPFNGYSGVIVRGQARLRLVVSITMLRKSVAIEFDRGAVARSSASQRPRGEARSAVA